LIVSGLLEESNQYCRLFDDTEAVHFSSGPVIEGMITHSGSSGALKLTRLATHRLDSSESLAKTEDGTAISLRSSTCVMVMQSLKSVSTLRNMSYILASGLLLRQR
jgi:hypothetical protein